MTTAVENLLQTVKDHVKQVVDSSLETKQFKTGSRGFWLQSRETIDGKKYMLNIQVVEVGSKNE